MYYATMQITFLTRKFRNGERNLHCDVVHITTKWVSSLTLDCNGVFAIKAYGAFECGRIYRVYEFRLGNNVRVTSQLVFASRELVTKKAAPVSDLHLVSIIACTRSRR